MRSKFQASNYIPDEMGPKLKKKVGKKWKSVKGVCRVSGPISLKRKNLEVLSKKTIWESVLGKYVKNQLEPNGLKNGLVIWALIIFIKLDKIINKIGVHCTISFRA